MGHLACMGFSLTKNYGKRLGIRSYGPPLHPNGSSGQKLWDDFQTQETLQVPFFQKRTQNVSI